MTWIVSVHKTEICQTLKQQTSGQTIIWLDQIQLKKNTQLEARKPLFAIEPSGQKDNIKYKYTLKTSTIYANCN